MVCRNMKDISSEITWDFGREWFMVDTLSTVYTFFLTLFWSSGFHMTLVVTKSRHHLQRIQNHQHGIHMEVSDILGVPHIQNSIMFMVPMVLGYPS